jgi:hypothetical protein
MSHASESRSGRERISDCRDLSSSDPVAGVPSLSPFILALPTRRAQIPRGDLTESGRLWSTTDMETVDSADPADHAGRAVALTDGARRLAFVSLGCAAAAVAVIAWATANRNHAFWAFAAWVGFTIAAVATGVTALVRMPRRREVRGLRRLATLGVVGGVLCATLGLAVYSASRTDDCPLERQCVIPQSGPGQRSQQP